MSDLMHALQNIHQQNLPLLPTGRADDIQTLWEDVIKHTLPKKDRVVAMFDVLKRYVEDDDAVFFIRHGSVRKDGDPKTLRRGFLTTFSGDKHQYVYTDNDLATIIYKLTFDSDWDINYDEFKTAMLNRTFPCHFNKSCSEEKDKAAYPISATAPYKAPSVGESGYKVSHLFGTGTEYAFDDGQILNITEICDNYFPLGDYDDWKERTPDFYTRELPGSLCNEALSFLKAHFLRFACPINYILTPKTTCQIPGRKLTKNDVGEHPRLLDFAKEQLRIYYGRAVFDTYSSMLMMPDDDYIGLDYGLPKSKKSATTTPAAKPTPAATAPAKAKTAKPTAGTIGHLAAHYTYDQQLETAAYYFKNTVGLIPVEENHLKLYDRKGWVAKDILNVLGVDTNGAYKGLLLRSSIDDAIAKATGTLKTTLEEIKKRRL